MILFAKLVVLLTITFGSITDSYGTDISSFQAEDETEVLENWLSTLERANQIASTSGESVFDLTSQLLFELYLETQNSTYLNYSLHEAGRSQRLKIIANLEPEIDIFELQPYVSDKLIRGAIQPAYYEIRPFSVDDVYTFIGSDIPQDLEESAKELLDYWYRNLPDVIEQNSLKGSIKKQTLIYGYNRLDNFQKVFELGIDLKRNHPFPDSYFTLSLFETISYSARVLGYYSQSLAINQDILQPISYSLGDFGEFLTTKMDYALLLFRVGNVSASLAEFESVYEQDYSYLDSRYRAALFNNLAISYLNSGQFDRYVQFQLNAFEVASDENNYSQQLSILRNLFIYYRRQNDTDLAFNYLNQALQIARENQLTTDIASTLISLGIYKRTVEQEYDQALEHYYNALDISEETNNYQHNYMSHLEIGETYLIKQDWGQAEKYFKRAMELTSSREDSRNFTQSSIRYANMLSLEGRFDEADNLLSQFNEEDFLQQYFNIRVLANNVKIRILKKNSHFENAINYSSSIISEIIDHLRESSDLQTGHMRMDDEFTEAFKLHSLLMYETDQHQRALSTIGELRNISRSGFYNNPLLKSKVLTEEELIQDYNISQRIQQLRSRYQTATGEQRVYLGNELLNAISERNRLQSQAFPNYNEQQYEQLFSRLRRSLRSDQMIFYFSVFDDDIFRFSITRSGITMKVYSAEGNHLDMLREGLDTIGYRTTDLHKLHKVYTTFFDGDIPGGIRHIYMIPDADFYRMPLEILPIQMANTPNSYGSANYLIEEYSVSYLNSLTELVRDPDADFVDYEYDMVGFGIENFREAGYPLLQNLPFSSKEIKQSYNQLDGFKNKTFFLESESTERNFRNLAGNSRILHLATHSQINDENPLFSTLYLYPDNTLSDQLSEYDGIIHAYELFDMNLNADLIFLSSCESGAGGYLQGSGVLGFSRAFSFAGAKSLSMNLWPVRDQTASEISTNFYRSLNEGENKAESLRQARLNYLNNTNSDPYLWGSFVLYGDISSPLPQPNRFAAIFFLSLGFVIVFGSSIVVMISYRANEKAY